MCGIVGAIAKRNVSKILLEGLKHLEYRGYDSAGVAIVDAQTNTIARRRTKGKVNRLVASLNEQPLRGPLGIAHTRWATHGQPNETNAHPHFSHAEIAIVHNGIIENHDALRKQLIEQGYQFESETDTEVIAHLIHSQLQQEQDSLQAIRKVMQNLHGAYALGIILLKHPQQLIAVKNGSPLVIGRGIEENFIASDPIALSPVTQNFIYLEEDDIALITTDKITIYNQDHEIVQRPVHKSRITHEVVGKGKFRHYMQKEIFEQADALCNTLEGHIAKDHLLLPSFGSEVLDILDKIKRVHIVACGTSYHTALVMRDWLESLAKIPCTTEIASENRYRDGVVEADTLFVAISQSGETADTLAAFHQAPERGYAATLGICNVAESTLAREADITFVTLAGIEIGVAATKTFTTQLAAGLLLALAIAKKQKNHDFDETEIIKQLSQLPRHIKTVLALDDSIKKIAKSFAKKSNALFLGRGIQHPIALEGALKLKEISYIHAEAYPAGELKHGPLALIDKDMPIIVIATNDAVINKLKSNIEEVQTRGGELYIFSDENIDWPNTENTTIIPLPTVDPIISPILTTIPLQQLAYHVAVQKGTDVDHPRNLAKSVTVE